MTLIVRIFFVGLISFTPTDDEPGKDWLALLLDAQDEYGIAAHAPGLHYCTNQEPRCSKQDYEALRNQRLSFRVDPARRLAFFQPHTYEDCDPDYLQAPESPECARDYRWIVGAKRTLGRYTKRRWCCRDWKMLRACYNVSHVILEHGELQNCRFVEGGPPTLPTRAIYGLAGLRRDGRSRVASEVSMVKIEVPEWQATDQFVLCLRSLPPDSVRTCDREIELHGTPCETGKACIDILIDNRPHHVEGQTYRSLITDHFDLYRTVWGRRGRRAGKIQLQLNEGLQIPLDLQPCGNDESPLLSGELVLGAGNERPICPQNSAD